MKRGILEVFFLIILFFSGSLSALEPDYSLSLLPGESNKLVFSELEYSENESVSLKESNISRPVFEKISDSLDESSSLNFSNSDESVGILDKDLIRITIKQGENERKTLGIKNYMNYSLEINLSSEFEYIIIHDTSFVLEPGEVKLVDIDFFSKYTTPTDSYIGSIIIQSQDYKKEVKIILDILEKKPLFDVLTNLEKGEIYSGDKLKADIIILNMGNLMNIDILLHYSITEFGSNTIINYKEECLAINKSLNLSRELRVPENIESGKYVFNVKSSYQNISATGAEVFKIKERKQEDKNIFYQVLKTIMFFFIFLVFCFMILKIIQTIKNNFYSRNNKKKRKKQKTKTRKYKIKK